MFYNPSNALGQAPAVPTEDEMIRQRENQIIWGFRDSIGSFSQAVMAGLLTKEEARQLLLIDKVIEIAKASHGD